MTVTGNFDRFQYFNCATSFLDNENLFQKKLEYLFYLKILRLKTHQFHTKLSSEKPMLRQIEWEVQKSGVLPVATLFFWKFCFSLRTSYNELIWCKNQLNVHIHTFLNHWSFIWQCFSPVSILILNFRCRIFGAAQNNLYMIFLERNTSIVFSIHFLSSF